MRPRILVVEDDAALGAQIRATLERAGHDVVWLRDGDAAAVADPARFDLVLLDLMLPGTYGMDVLKRLRRHSGVPLMILSARNETPDKVRALHLGADDYVTKPFLPEELLARVRARLRRPSLEREDRLHVGPITIDVPGRRVEVDGTARPLTPSELEFLLALARRPGAVVTRSALAAGVLHASRGASERTLDAHALRLRRKLGARARHLRTAWGIGYCLEPEAPA